MMDVNTEGLVKGVSYDTEPEKLYLILIDGEEVDNEGRRFRDWEIVEGRQAAYDYIKSILESEYVLVDVNESKIIVSSEKVKITDGISIYEFMKVMKEKDKVIDYTSFDIEDYVNGDVEGE
jgi:hypothetical protein